MVDDVVYLFGAEFMKDGHCHCPVGEDGEEGDPPVSAVAAAKGNLVALLDANLLHHDMQLLYLTGNVLVLKRHSFVISESIVIPI